MEFLQTLLDNSTMPVVTAFLLGLITAMSPCPLATNIVAIGFIGRDIESRRSVFLNGVLYTLGKVLAYSILGIILIIIIKEGASFFGIQKFIGKYGEMIIGPALLLIGVLMLFSDKIKLPSFGFNGDGERIARKGRLGSFLLGILFALTFCPSSGIFYFGMLIPLSASSTMGYFLPTIFAIATALPVLIVAWILAFSAGHISKIYGQMQKIQKYLNIIVSVLFISIGIYYCITIYL